MSDLPRMDGYITLWNSMLAQYGLLTAAIYGHVHRCCQGGDGNSLFIESTIDTASRFDCSDDEVKAALDVLVTDGRLIDVSADFPESENEVYRTPKSG